MVIQTILGNISGSELGFCHSHEHLFIAKGKPSQLNKDLRLDDFAKTKEELQSYKRLGGSAVVDAQPLGCGRMAELLVEVSRQTGVHIIASTGFHKMNFYPDSHWLFRKDGDNLARIFIAEIEEGMYLHTENEDPVTRINATAGVIKTAIDEDHPGSICVKLMNAAAHASLETGIPIMCHTETHRQGIVITEHFMKLGVTPGNIIVCHLDRSLDDYSVHKQLAQYGVFVEYDTIGRYKYHDDESEAKLILQMLEWGLGSSILLGLDTTRARLKSYGGAIGLDHIAESFLPLLRRRGVPERAITDMMVNNPAKAFTRKRRNFDMEALK